MDKQAFLAQLRKKLSGLPQSDIAERLTFYSEMIDDRMEEGLSEEQAVAAVGAVDEIAADISSAKDNVKRKHNPWVTVLLVLGCPVWLSLLFAALAVTVALYASVWAMIVALWAVFGSVAVCAPTGIAAGAGFALSGSGLVGVAMIGAGILCAGLSIFLFFLCSASTKGTLLLTKKLVLGIKNRFTGKEAV